MRRVALIGAIVLCVGGATPAIAVEQHGDATMTNNGTVTVGITVTSPGNASTGASGGQHELHASNTPIITYQVVGEQAAHTGDLTGWCWIDAAAGIPGYQYWIIGTNSAGTVVSNESVCQPYAADDHSVPPDPPPVPVLPTVEEVWNAAQLPPPTIHTDPATRGITGLDTIITAAATAVRPITASLHGYTITGTATPQRTTVIVDGSEPLDAPTHYMFDTKGTHTIVAATAWRATATLTGPGLTAPLLVDDLGTATITTTRRYPVHEIRAQLTG